MGSNKYVRVVSVCIDNSFNASVSLVSALFYSFSLYFGIAYSARRANAKTKSDGLERFCVGWMHVYLLFTVSKSKRVNRIIFISIHELCSFVLRSLYWSAAQDERDECRNTMMRTRQRWNEMESEWMKILLLIVEMRFILNETGWRRLIVFHISLSLSSAAVTHWIL